MLDYDGDDFQDVFGIAFEVKEHFVVESFSELDLCLTDS